MTSLQWRIWRIIYRGIEWHACMLGLWSLIQFANFQAHLWLKRIHISKSLFFCNDPASCCWIDEVGHDHDGEYLWVGCHECRTLAWSDVIIVNLTFVKSWMGASSKKREDVWWYFHHTVQGQYCWYFWTQTAWQGRKDERRDHVGRYADNISRWLRSTPSACHQEMYNPYDKQELHPGNYRLWWTEIHQRKKRP